MRILTCPECGKKGKLPVRATLGRTIRCPRCKSALEVLRPAPARFTFESPQRSLIGVRRHLERHSKLKPWLQEALMQLLVVPEREAYLALRARVIRGERLDHLVDTNFRELEQLLEQRRFEQVLEQCLESMEYGVLTARFHRYAAFAASQLGEEDIRREEHFLAGRCLHWLDLTGHGSRRAPVVVTCVADEYDYLRGNGREPNQRDRVERSDGQFDVFVFGDGSELWFEVSDLLAQELLAA